MRQSLIGLFHGAFYSEFMNKWLLCSLSLHGLLLWIFLGSWRHAAELSPLKKKTSIQWLETSSDLPSSKTKQQRSNKQFFKKHQKKLSDLSVRLHSNSSLFQGSGSEAGLSGTYDFSFEMGNEYGGGHLLQQRLDVEPVLKKLWRRIKLHSYYHPQLLNAKIQGRVHGEVLIDRRGFLKRVLFLHGQSDLKAWVKMSLYRAFEFHAFKGLEKDLVVRLEFRYQLAGGWGGSSIPPDLDVFAFTDNSLIFQVTGYLGSPADSARRAFTKKVFRRTRVWNFNELYSDQERACRVNQSGCEKYQELKAQFGNTEPRSPKAEHSPMPKGESL